jgi:hypothetical protein
MTPLDIAVVTARQADLAAVFNYASQAHNNHFFFESLVRGNSCTLRTDGNCLRL